jgi:transposase
MMVLGADLHKSSHTVAAVDASTGELLGDRTIQVGSRGFASVLEWARGRSAQRVWALEDCRHVSGSFERFLIARGERVVRVAPRLMADSRRGLRDRGKSDQIDALAVARAALRERIETLPAAQLAGVELDLRLLVDHRERLVRQRTALTNDVRWNIHDLWPELTIPPRSLASAKWLGRLSRRLARAEQSPRVRIARDELRRIAELTRAICALEKEIAVLVGEIAGADRFSSDAKLARAAGLAPIPVSSGRTNRHRLDRGGNRQINAAIHRIALTRSRIHPETIAFIARKTTEGRTHRDAMRALKRHLARRIWQLLRTPPVSDTNPTNINFLT